MLYRNVKTGAVVKTPCKISGKNWELVEEIPTGTFEEDAVEQEVPVEKLKRTRRGGK